MSAFLPKFDSDAFHVFAAGKKIVPEVLIEYLVSVGYEANADSRALVSSCLKQCNRESGLQSEAEFVDLFLPVFSEAIASLALQRKASRMELNSDKPSSSTVEAREECHLDGLVPNPVPNTKEKPVFGSMKKLCPGIGSYDDIHHRWCCIDATRTFNVRGHTYLDDGVKVKSDFTIFDPVGAEIFCGDDINISFPGEQFYFPHVSSEPTTNGVPNRLLISLVFPNFPVENALWGKKQEEGPCHIILYCFELSKRARAQLLGKEPLTKAVRLAKEYLAEPDSLHAQTKIIFQLFNVEAVDVGFLGNTLLSQYNGKPFLSNKSHRTKWSEGCVQITVNVNTFAHMARSYYADMHPFSKNWIMDCAFVVEGRESNQLPEQILACIRNIRPNLSTRLVSPGE